ncbi:DUF3667 domain-containing protein [Lacinutrix iliipiscaria]|uniref:DUF3667 domain-containing protein n=1 Tax=Lacinutrix iliipiscaria TaxID=1230532 RepID=A0ABW5WNA1_9FLAO
MSVQLKDCKNCEQPFNEVYEFCPYCGQKDKDELTIGVLFYNTISNYFSFDARFFKSFIPLLFRPGYLATKFIEGKRLLYLHPAQMYLFIAVVFFFLNSFNVNKWKNEIDTSLAKTLNKEKVLDTVRDEKVRDSLKLIELSKLRTKDSIAKAAVRKALEDNKVFTGMTQKEIDSLVSITNAKNNNLNFDFNEKEIDSLIAVGASENLIYRAMGMPDDAGRFKRHFYGQMLKFYKSREGGSILQRLYDTIPIAMFFLLPLFALILKILYIKRGRYAHHLVFSFYYFSFLFTVFSIIIGINFVWDIPDWIDWLVAFSTFFYLFFALKRFYQQGWFWSFFKASLTAFVFVIFVAPLAMMFLSLFAFYFY